MGKRDMYYIEERDLWRKRVAIGGVRREFTAPTQREVRQKIDDAKLLHKQGLLDASAVTVTYYATKWYMLKSPTVGASAAANYDTSVNKHIIPKIGHMLIGDVVKSDIQGIMSGLADMSYSLNHQVYITLNQIFSAAVDDKLIADNPCKNIKRGGRRPNRVSALNKDQQKEVIRAAKGKHLYILSLLCLLCGLRPEEARGLQWEDVHLDGSPYLQVKHAVVYDSVAIYTSDLKSRASYRDVPIPTLLAKELRGRQRKAGFVVPALTRDIYISESTYSRCWRDITADIDREIIPFDITPHKHLRRTYVTELCASGMDIKKIQYLAGHDDIKITLAIYADVVNNRPEQVIDHINKVFDSIAI